MSGRGGDEGVFLSCLKHLDEHTNVKLLLRVWGPRFEFAVRLILVATFLDDSFRVATHFSEHTKQISEGYLKLLAATAPGLVSALASATLVIGLLAQFLGSLCLIALQYPDYATKALIGWTIVQPVLYAQLTNSEFVAESLSLVGGLLILRAHLSDKANGDSWRANEAFLARTQLLGRLLIPAVYLYHAGRILLNNLAGAQRGPSQSLALFFISKTTLGCRLILGCALLLGCTLVAFGLKSRAVALLLAILNLGFVCHQHPFFCFVWREGGEWKYDEAKMKMSRLHVAQPQGESPDDFEPWHLLDLHQYYFFQGLSTTGALLLLVQFGPGEIAVQADEVLLGDVQMARDYRPVPCNA